MATPKTPEPKILSFFSKGLVTNRQPLFSALTNIGIQVAKFDDALIDGVNMESTDRYTVQRRPAFTKYCSEPLQSGEVPLAFYSVKNLQGVVSVILDTNLAVYWLTTTPQGTPPTSYHVILNKSTSNQAFLQTVGNITYISDGMDFVKWNGTTMAPWGIDAPPVAPPIISSTLRYPGSWIASFPYLAGTTILDVNGSIEYCTQPGLSGKTFPVWNTTVGASTIDGLATWENVGNAQLYWIASNPYTVPTVITDTNSNLQLATAVTSGGTSGTGAPVWNEVRGGSTTDSGITWLNIGPALVWAYVGWSYVYAYRCVSGNLSTSSPISVQTGPMMSSQSLSPITVTAYVIASNVITVTAVNNFEVGQSVTFNGFPNSTFLNGQTVIVASLVGSPGAYTGFTAVFANPNAAASEVGQGYPVILTLTGTGSRDPECNSVANITGVTVLNDVVTINAINNFVPGLSIYFSGLVNATFLNGQTLYVASTNAIAPGSATQFTVNLQQANYDLAPDTGTGTFCAVEIYRIDDGGGVYYFDNAVVNPTGPPLSSYDSGSLLAGSGVDSGMPGSHVWANPNNVTSPSSYATVTVPSSGSGGAFNIAQSATVGGCFTYNGGGSPTGPAPSSVTLLMPNVVAGGNQLLLYVFSRTQEVLTVTDTNSNAWTLVDTYTYTYTYYPSYSDTYTVACYTCPAPGATALNITIGLTADVGPSYSGETQAIAMEMNGLTASPIDVFNAVWGTGTSLSTGTVTTTNAPDAVMSVVWTPALSAVQPTGYALVASEYLNNGSYVSQFSAAYENQTATGTFTPTWTDSASAFFYLGMTTALKSNLVTYSDALKATTFPESVPAGVTAVGIKVTFDALYTGAAGIGALYVQLLKNGNPYGSIKTVTPTLSNVNYTLGGTGDLWGAIWVTGDFPPSTLWGVQFTAGMTSGGPWTFSVRDVRAEIYGEYGVTTWTFNDIFPDSQLDNEEVAPLAHANDPPPGSPGSLVPIGGTISAFWSGRLWLAAGNQLLFSGGGDVINGIGNECFPPGNSWTFPGPITGLMPSGGGLVVTTSSQWWAILGGPETTTFYPEKVFDNFGCLNPNCLRMDMGVIYVYTSQKQVFQVQGTNQNEVSFWIAPTLNGQDTPSVTASAWNPANSYLAVHREGEDAGMFLSNDIDSMLRMSLRYGNWSTIYQPNLGTAAGSPPSSTPRCGAIQSVETQPGQFTLLVGDTQPGGFIYQRNLDAFEDDGGAYPANAIIGNIVCAEMGEPMVPLHFFSGYFMNVGNVPAVSFLPNEIFTTDTRKFTPLPVVQNEPVFLIPSQSLMAKRWPVLMNQNATPLMVKHVQINVDFGSDTAKNELLIAALRFSHEQMT